MLLTCDNLGEEFFGKGPIICLSVTTSAKNLSGEGPILCLSVTTSESSPGEKKKKKDPLFVSSYVTLTSARTFSGERPILYLPVTTSVRNSPEIKKIHSSSSRDIYLGEKLVRKRTCSLPSYRQPREKLVRKRTYCIALSTCDNLSEKLLRENDLFSAYL